MWKWETENEAKGVIVIAHNMLEHTGRYAYVITMLRRNGYHVIMGDLPGTSTFSSRFNIIKPPNPTPNTYVGILYSFAILIHSSICSW